MRGFTASSSVQLLALCLTRIQMIDCETFSGREHSVGHRNLSAGMRLLSWFGILFICFVSGGATCTPRNAPMPFPPPPTVLNETPSLEQIARVVNRSQVIR